MVDIKAKLRELPMSPGVYIMKNADGEVIYVGKSKHLKNRVSSYFINSKNHTPKTVAMVSNVADFDYIMTDSEVEALVLECNLIKKYLPKYNILLKDDKQYPYIKITMGEDYPRIYMTRKICKDGARYFGPYMSSMMVRTALETIKRIFKVRSCSKRLPVSSEHSRPCLYYHIGQCSAPCCGKISKEDYKDTFDRIALVLEGKYDKITEELKEKMYEESEKLEFEKAARYRDKIESIKMLGEKQKMLSVGKDNRDIIGVFKGEFETCVQIFYMRDGRIQGSEYFVFKDENATVGEITSEFMKQYYYSATNIPGEILIPEEISDGDSIADWLSEKTSHKIRINVPQRGEKAKLIKMVNKNAEETLRQHIFKRNREEMQQNDVLSELARVLSLPKAPFRIESYDISNISGAQSIGVCVVYNNAKASKKDYRKFNIKTVEGTDDYESTREVIARRINRAYDETQAVADGSLSPEKTKFLPLPDLILLDGGKGHVSAVRMLMETLGEDIPVYGLVKDDKHRTRALTDIDEEFDVEPDSLLFRFLSEVQEEVHRFAITSFRKRHENATVYSALEKIPGIGEAKRKKLLNTFISIEKISKASYEELCGTLDKRAAKSVYEYFKANGSDKNE